jgi:hypothetical protein
MSSMVGEGKADLSNGAHLVPQFLAHLPLRPRPPLRAHRRLQPQLPNDRLHPLVRPELPPRSTDRRTAANPASVCGAATREIPFSGSGTGQGCRRCAARSRYGRAHRLDLRRCSGRSTRPVRCPAPRLPFGRPVRPALRNHVARLRPASRRQLFPRTAPCGSIWACSLRQKENARSQVIGYS